MSSSFMVGKQLEANLADNAHKKATNPIIKTLFLGFLAGFWVGIGGIAGLSVAGSIPPAIRAAWPVLPRFGLGFFFPLALHFIVLFGGELFTGNCMILPIGLFNRRLTWLHIAKNWSLVYLANFVGCIFTAYFFGYLTHYFDAEPFRSYVQTLAEAKTMHYSFGTSFLRAIPANTLVCMAVWLGSASQDGAGKFFNLWFPAMLFVVCAFEHSVANMFFVNLGLLYGAKSTIGWMLYNQLAVAMGNIVGGTIIMACSNHLINHWKSPSQENESMPTYKNGGILS